MSARSLSQDIWELSSIAATAPRAQLKGELEEVAGELLEIEADLINARILTRASRRNSLYMFLSGCLTGIGLTLLLS